MPAFTPNLNLYKPGGGSTGAILPDEVVDIDRINANSDILDLAIGSPASQNRQWYGPAASINTLPVSPKDGDTYQESDGNKILWRRVGGVWVTIEDGMYLLRPASVVNGAVNAAGEIVPTAASSCSVNGVFSSRFREYVIRFSLVGSTNNGLQFVLRNAGADSSGSIYANQSINTIGAGAPATASGTLVNVALSASGTTSAHNGGSLEVTNPATAGGVKGGFLQNGSSTLWRSGRWQGSGIDANTYDGFTLSLTAGTFNVSFPNFIKVYGLA